MSNVEKRFVGSLGRGRGRGRGNDLHQHEKPPNAALWVHSRYQPGMKVNGPSSTFQESPVLNESSISSRDNAERFTEQKADESVGKDFKLTCGDRQFKLENKRGEALNLKDKGLKELSVIDHKSKSTNRLEQMQKEREYASKFADYFDEEDSSDHELQDEEIIKATFSSYKENENGDQPYSTQHLIDLLQDGATTCIICYETVKHADPIWSCNQCYCIFHIQCIQKWCKEGLAVKNLYNEDVRTERTIWCCPKCRRDYQRDQCPEKYMCFCGKQADPKFDPWIVPHSCGQACGKKLEPTCGHECVLLCHPGPCPPCPKMVRANCHCGAAKPLVKRCSAKEWSCGGVCGKALACGHHTCHVYCHPGVCPPCPKKSTQSCQCGKFDELRACAEPLWHCQEPCGRIFPCGNHKCEQICHSDACGDCPRSGIRTCPCGKTSLSLPCTEDTPTCEDTCNKELACKRHQCIRKCHFGPCETCRQVLVKSCRCGKREKEVPCYQEYTCDFKCTNMRACGRHACKRKCCDGNCPPCEQMCNRTLSCRNHKCPAQCHKGSCYPCPLKKEVTCFCGKTVLNVACGKERSIRPPKCSQLCKIPPTCHHTSRKAHRCHFGSCPTCVQVCDLSLAGCDHLCREPCHDHIPANKKVGFRKPWEKAEEKDEFTRLPCPPCQTLVKRSCLGRHETIDVPCSEDKPYSCKAKCGRLLGCENHYCSKDCHLVKDAEAENKAGRNCRKCNEFCSKGRPTGCIHDCKLPCHPGYCPDCSVMVRKPCHCGLIMLYVKCYELTTTKDTSLLLSCKSQCSKYLDCGHQCPSVCHTGACADTTSCEQKTKIFCKCKRKRKDVPCSIVRAGGGILDCDERCQELKSKQEKDNTEKEAAKKDAERKRQMEELEWFEKKKQGRKRKQRKRIEGEEESSLIEKYKLYLIGAFVIILVGLVLAYLLSKGTTP